MKILALCLAILAFIVIVVFFNIIVLICASIFISLLLYCAMKIFYDFILENLNNIKTLTKK